MGEKVESKDKQGSIPISYEAERAVLTALLTNEEAVADILSTVVPEDFTRLEYRNIFCVVAGLFLKQEPIDIVTVSTGYREHYATGPVFDDLFKQEFSGRYPSHVRVLKDFSRRRKLLQDIDEARESIAGSDNTDETVSNLMTALIGSNNGNTRKAPVPLGKAVLMSMKRIEKAVETGSTVTGIPTGFSGFDEQMGGLQPGELIIVGARPSIGKSALLANIALGAARRGHTSLIVNAEMELIDVGTRMLAAESGIPNVDLRRGNLFGHDDFPKLIKASQELDRCRVWIYDDTRWDVIQAQIRSMKMMQQDLSLVVIDYIQRIKAKHEKEEKRYEVVGRIAREAKDLAKDLKIPIVLAAQIGRQVVKEHREPELPDLRESGDLEQEGDMCGFLHWYPYKKGEQIRHYWLIKKNRNGPLGSIRLKWVGDDVSYYDWDG